MSECLLFTGKNATKTQLMLAIKGLHGNSIIKIDGKRVQVISVDDSGTVNIFSDKNKFLGFTKEDKNWCNPSELNSKSNC